MAIHMCSKKYWVIIFCMCLIAAYGCNRSSSPPPNPVAQSSPGPSAPVYGPTAGPPPTYGPTAGPSPTYGPGAGSSSTSAIPPGPKPQFLDFSDIPIPPELGSPRRDNSYVFQSGQIKMGFLTLRGRVDPNSVMNFFVTALPREGWRLRGQFRYNRALLIFDKPDKTCVILMKESTYYTYVEIYVAPSTGT